jgi:uncharacterized protein YkwD
VKKIFETLGFIIGLSLIGALSFTAGHYWSFENSEYEVDRAETEQKKQLEEANGLIEEYQSSFEETEKVISELNSELMRIKMQLTPTEVRQEPAVAPAIQSGASFTGEDLWQAVNKYRREHGVPELKLKGSLCELSSRRLGELLALGSLDNHEGFERYFENRQVTSLGITNVAENLASGYPGAWETVMGWDSSPGHKTFLLADGAYIWGCASANQGYAVLIGGY